MKPVRKKLFIALTVIHFCLPGIVSAQEGDELIEYLYPIPDSKYISPQATIIIRIKDETSLSAGDFTFTVRGTGNYNYPGSVILSDNKEVCIFKPDSSFRQGDNIISNVKYKDLFGTNGYEFAFYIAEEQLSFKKKASGEKPNISQKSLVTNDYSIAQEIPGSQPILLNGVAVPSDFPLLDVSISDITAPGYLFLTTYSDTRYLLMLMNDGTPYYYRRVNLRARDFKVQPTGVISWSDSDSKPLYVIMDNTYTIKDTLRAGHGYKTDDHDVQLLSSGHVLVIGNDHHKVDMSQIVEGGRTNAIVVGHHLQELDTNRNVVFEFRSWDHFNILDALHEDHTSSWIDIAHINSVDLDYDGHYLISSRNLDEVTKIHRKTGEIIWRLGGVNNEFEFVNDPDQFTYQHDFRPVKGSPGNYTLFDNGVYHDSPHSRAVEYSIDTSTMTANMVWEYNPSPAILSRIMGNVQRLPNGNTLINWALRPHPKAMEVTPQGSVVYEADYITPNDCYRSFRFEWDGKMKAPYLISEPFFDRIRLIFNKFGDDKVDYYNVYFGANEESFTYRDSTSKTWMDIFDLMDEETYYFAVSAVDQSGSESNLSNTEKVTVNFAAPGENLILNGNFTTDDRHWALITTGNAVATGSTGEKTLTIEIDNEGDKSDDIRLIHNNISLIEGKEYILSFEAWAQSPGIIDTKIEKTIDPCTDYGKYGSTYLTATKQKFQYSFPMTRKTDTRARFVLNAGGNDATTIYIKNVRLVEYVETNKVSGISIDPLKLKYNPNPAGDFVQMSYYLPYNGKGTIELFDITGKSVFSTNLESRIAGNQEIVLDISGFPAGIYILKLHTVSYNHKHRDQQQVKFIKY